MKRIASGLQTLCARYGKPVAAASLGALAVSGAFAIWSLAIAQQPYPAPYPPGNQAPPPNYDRAYPQPGNRARRPSQEELRCAQLEHELANQWVSRHQGADSKQAIEAEIRKQDRIFQQTQARAERSGCYRSNFIFGRSLVRTPKCLRLNNRIEDARRRLESLNAQRQASSGGGNRRRDDLVAALARAGCGTQYQRQANRNSGGFFSWLEEGFWDAPPRRDLQTSRIEQFATYRTLCVRSCDGYYFPVSFSTLPSNFSQDFNRCQSRCAAPAELFVYRNPGEEAEQMVSSDGRQAYADLPNAWRYRKEFVKGCSCKEAEYDPTEIAAANEKAEAEAAAKAGTPPPSGGAQFADDKDKPKTTQ